MALLFVSEVQASSASRLDGECAWKPEHGGKDLPMNELFAAVVDHFEWTVEVNVHIMKWLPRASAGRRVRTSVL